MNFSFNFFVYVIKFNSEWSLNNDIFVICGGEYKKIVDFFLDFIDLYLNDFIEF